MKKNLFSIPALAIALATTVVSCKKDSTTTSTGNIPASHPITSDTISGFVKGTLLSGKTYYITGDVTVKPGDTLSAQSGANVVVSDGHQVLVQGTLYLVGTQSNPVVFNSKSGKSDTLNGWDGFICDSAQSVNIQWTKIINAGGPDASGSPTKSIEVKAPIPVTITDSWIVNGQDDQLALQNGAKLTILRNTIQSSGSNDGEAINIKSGCTGVVAYNVIYNQAGSGIKMETSTTAGIAQTKIDVFNNTIVSIGWRRGLAEPGRAISVDKNAVANIYNNIFANNYQDLEVFTGADTINTKYGNNLFFASQATFGTADTSGSGKVNITLASNFYPGDGVGKKQASDLVGVDPLFVSFDNQFLHPNGYANNNNFNLSASSPAKGKGNTTFTLLNAGIATPNTDLGAYPTDGSGNKH